MSLQVLRQWREVGWLVLGLSGLSPLLAGPSAEEPRITSVRLRGTNIQVTATVPAGLRKVTLESRSRLGSGAWEPRAVIRLDGTGSEVHLDLPISERIEVLRIRADAQEPLPGRFYLGTNRFAVQPATTTGGYREFGPGLVDNSGGTTPTANRAVEESDLWKRRGDTLFVFNQYRGLQVIDVAQPDEARLVGALDLPAVGDQMYLVGDRHAVLLARDRCHWDADTAESEIVVVDVSKPVPTVAAQVPIWGRISESRLVGTALYVASETSRPKPDGMWEWGVRLTAVDLADPAQPVLRDTLWFPGYGQAVTATPEFFFLATPDPGTAGTSTLHCLDITSPDGRTALYATLKVFGRVPDKFKMDWAEGVLRVVSERQASGGGLASLSTRLETFRLPDPRSMGPLAPGKLGEVELVQGERLFASRFDGPRAYVVTYRVVDPLWVVDLSDPVKPRIAGALHVPGWSTYIQPFGNRLVSVGIDDTGGRRVAVSLFDVTDPGDPALLKRVSLGEGWSWSEANYDEKAVTILPEAGLLMVPYIGSTSQGASDGVVQSRVQLIDFDLVAGSLALRGEIPHRFDARRTMLHRERILSLSSTELLTVDATDRDRPSIRHKLPLAWSVDALVLHGDWLIEVTAGDSWSGSSPSLCVAPAAAPQDYRSFVTLPGAWPVVSATARADRLYVVRCAGDSMVGPPDPTQPGEDPPNLEIRVYDLTRLPNELPLLGESTFTVKPLGWWTGFKPLWVKPDLLILAGGAYSWWWGPWWGGPRFLDGPAFRYMPMDQEVGASRLLAFDVASPADPKLASEIDLSAADRVLFSAAREAAGLVFVSHGLLEPPGPIENPVAGAPPLLPPEWFRVWRHELTVIDYADPADPTVRKPVELPGALRGLGAGGNLVYTVGTHWVPGEKWEYDSTEWLDALAYDGVAAHQVASLKLPTGWPRPVHIARDQIWLGRVPATTDSWPALEHWGLTENGEFVLVGQLRLPEPPADLRLFDTLLAAQSGLVTRLVDVSTPSSPRLISTHQPEGCLWLSLEAAVGTADRGLWFPAGMYGVTRIPLP